jgi:hypothetical protein
MYLPRNWQDKHQLKMGILHQLRQQQQIAGDKGKASLSYINKELPSKRTEFKQNKLAEKPILRATSL